jgi:hypothetical protein
VHIKGEKRVNGEIYLFYFMIKHYGSLHSKDEHKIWPVWRQTNFYFTTNIEICGKSTDIFAFKKNRTIKN